jgi:hypothetical protein
MKESENPRPASLHIAVLDFSWRPTSSPKKGRSQGSWALSKYTAPACPFVISAHPGRSFLSHENILQPALSPLKHKLNKYKPEVGNVL